MCTGPSIPIHRRDAQGLKYYFIDFGISSKFEDGQPHSVVGGDGLDLGDYVLHLFVCGSGRGDEVFEVGEA